MTDGAPCGRAPAPPDELPDEFEPISERDAALADDARRRLQAVARGGAPVAARFGAEEVEIPAAALRLLEKALDYMAYGNRVGLTALRPELTVGQAADLLQVSRDRMQRLLDDGKIPRCDSGVLRQVRIDDVLAYRREADRRRRKVLDALTAQDQELGLL